MQNLAADGTEWQSQGHLGRGWSIWLDDRESLVTMSASLYLKHPFAATHTLRTI